MRDFLETLLAPSSATGAIHVTLAIICLILGPIILRRPKGDARHKFWGRSWAAMMLILNISALMTYEIDGQPNLFHFFAVMNLAALIPGLFYIRKFARAKNPTHLQLHRELMVWAYFGLAAAGVWQIATSLAKAGLLDTSQSLIFNSLSVATFVASFALAVFFAKNRRTPRNN